MKRSRQLRDAASGFTLPELLAVVVLFLIILGVTVVILRPKSLDAAQRDAQRRLELAQIEMAVSRYYADNGALPASITTKVQPIGSEDGEANLCNDLVPKYLKDIPLEPIIGARQVDGLCSATGQHYVSGYGISRAADNSWVKIQAPLAEKAPEISITHHY